MRNTTKSFSRAFYRKLLTPKFLTLLAVGLGAAFLSAPKEVAAQLQPSQSSMCPKWASSPLPDATEGKPYSASLGTNFNGTLTLSSDFNPFPKLPDGLELVGTSLKGTPTKPGPAFLTFKYTGSYPCPGSTLVTSGLNARYQISHSFQLKIRDVHPPEITVFTVTPPTVSTSGDNVAVLVKASDNVKPTRVVLTVQHPDGHKGSAILQGTVTDDYTGNNSGEWQQVISLAANTLETPVSYIFTLSVEDADGNVDRSGPITVTVEGRQKVLTIPKPKFP